jgi:hypothetical protein
VSASQLARGTQVHDDVRAQRGEQRERRDVVAQLAVVVVLDDQEPLGPRTRHERDPPRSRQPGAERELVCRRAVDGREARRQGVDDQPVAVHRHREHGEPGGAQRRGGPLVARLLHGHPCPARQGAGQLGDRRRGAARRQDGTGVGGQAAVSQQVLDDRAPERGQADRVGHDVRRSSAAARQARRHAARSSAATQGIPARRSTGAAPSADGAPCTIAARYRVGGATSGPACGAAGTATTKVPAPCRPATQPSASNWS